MQKMVFQGKGNGGREAGTSKFGLIEMHVEALLNYPQNHGMNSTLGKLDMRPLSVISADYFAIAAGDVEMHPDSLIISSAANEPEGEEEGLPEVSLNGTRYALSGGYRIHFGVAETSESGQGYVEVSLALL